MNVIHVVHISSSFLCQRVIELSKQYLPSMAVGYSDPRVKVHVQDGAEFLVDNKSSFDVIITDSSDPIGRWMLMYYLVDLCICCTCIVMCLLMGWLSSIVLDKVSNAELTSSA